MCALCLIIPFPFPSPLWQHQVHVQGTADVCYVLLMHYIAAQNWLVCLSGLFCEHLEKHKINNTYVTLPSSSAACPLQLCVLFLK